MGARVKLRVRRVGEGARSRGKVHETGIKRAGHIGCLAILFLTAAGRGFGATTGVREILRKVGKVYSSLESYHLVAERDVTVHRLHGHVSQRTAIILDAAPHGQVRMVLSGGGPNVVITSDGETAWQYDSRAKEYDEGSAAVLLGAPGKREEGGGQETLLGRMQDRLVARFVGLWRFADHATLKPRAQVESGGRKVPCYRIVLRLNGQRDEFWISQSSFLVLRERLQEGKRGHALSWHEEIRVKEFNPHPVQSADLFKFTPPAGARRVAAVDLSGVRRAVEGAAAGDFTIRDVEGKRVRLRDFRGKTVLLDFWATWCPACLRELPTLEKEWEQHQGSMVFLAVDNERKETIRKFLDGHPYRFTALVDPERKLFRQFGVRYLPTVFVINPEGIIVRRVVGWEGSQNLLPTLQAGEQ